MHFAFKADLMMPGTYRESRYPASLPRSARLLKPVDFKRVFSLNAASSDGCFRIIARPSVSAGHRLGMAVSRKVDRKAAGRNRIKRVVRESFRHWRACSAPAANGPLDIVVLPRPSAADRSNHQLFTSLERHWAALDQRVADRFAGKT